MTAISNRSSTRIRAQVALCLAVFVLIGILPGPAAAVSPGPIQAWGEGNSGQLGNGSTSSASTPVVVSSINDAVAVAAGWHHALGLRSDGTVWSWGYNGYGQLGNGTTTNSSSPVQVLGLSGVSVTAIAAGGNHSLALTSSGLVYRWGSVSQVNGGSDTYLTAQQVPSISDAEAIAAGDFHALMLFGNGEVWGYGNNNVGQLGDGTTVTLDSQDKRVTPVRAEISGATAIAGGSSHSLAVANWASFAGIVLSWGRNDHGQLGDGSTTDRSSPSPVKNASELNFGAANALAAGSSHSMAIRPDGSVWAWGLNSLGQLGDGTNTDRLNPVSVSGLSGATLIASRGHHSLAVAAGALTAWGNNTNGQLGNGTLTSSSIPVSVSGLSTASGIATGLAFSLVISGPAASIDRSSIDFGSIAVGSSSESENVTITNSGSGELNITSATLGGAHFEDFSLGECDDFSLSTGESCTFEIKFGPLAAGVRTATLSIDTNASASAYEVDLTGVGVLLNRIAFNRRLSTESSSVMLVDPGGSSLATLTTVEGATSKSPAWNPDGSEVAFSTDRDGNLELYRIGVDGTGLTRLTDHAARDEFPSYSPDGKKIAFASDRGDAGLDIYVLNLVSSSVARLTNESSDDFYPEWSPDGSRIVFTSDRNGPFQIFTMNAEGSDQQLLVEGDGAWPDWSPDGSKIAFTSDRQGSHDIFVVNADGTGLTALTNTPSLNEAEPAYSPDGERIAFHDVSGGPSGIFFFDADGSDKRRVTTNSDDSDFEPAWQPLPVQLAITVDESVIDASPSRAPTSELPLLPEGPDSSGLGSITIGSSPLGSISIGSSPLGSITIGSSPLGSISIGSSPLGSITIGSSPLVLQDALRTAYLADVPLVDGRPWEELLEGTPKAGIPIHNLTLWDIATLDPKPQAIEDLTWADLDLSASPLGSLSGAGILLGSETKLDDFTIPAPGFCERLALAGYSPSALGYSTCANLLAGASLTELELLGVDIAKIINWSGILLSDIDLHTAPINSVLLRSIHEKVGIGSTPVGIIRLAEIPDNFKVVDCGGFHDGVVVDCSGTSKQLLRDVPSAIGVSATFGDLGSSTGFITLGTLAFSFMEPDDKPWEDLSLESARFFDYGGPGSSKVNYHLFLTNQGLGALTDPMLQAQLPQTFRYVVGSSELVTGDPIDGFTVTPLPDPSIVGNLLAWDIDYEVSQQETIRIDFAARPGTKLGTFTISATVAAADMTSSIASQAPVRVREPVRAGDNPCEANDDPATAPIIEEGFLYSCHITSMSELDFYRLRAPVGGSRIQFFVSHLEEGADLDAVGYHPSGAAAGPLHSPLGSITIGSSPLGSISIGSSPLPDEGLGANNTAGSLQPQVLQDVPVRHDLLFAAASTFRGSSDEFIEIVSAGGSGYYTFQVGAYLGNFSDSGYIVRAKILPKVELVCPPTSFSFDESPSEGGDEVYPPFPSAIPTSTKTLILFNKGRIADVGGPQVANDIEQALNGYRARPEVMGAVLPVETIAQAEYAAWDASPCSSEAQNNIVRKINAEVNDLITPQHTSLKFMMIVGSGNVIPFALIDDFAFIANERSYAADLAFTGGQNPTFAAFKTAKIQSDDPYADFNPQKFLSGYLYVPDLALGRLGELTEILSALGRYSAWNGILDPQTYLTTGYDFMEDSAQAICDANQQSFGANNGQCLIGDGWTNGDLANALLGGTSAPDLVTEQFHGDHYRGLSGADNAASTTSGPFSSQLLRQALNPDGTSKLDATLFLSMACHTGTNIPDASVIGPALVERFDDWPQAATRQGAVVAAPTGYGYGEGQTIALSEMIMQLISGHVRAGGMSIAEAVMWAKQEYAANAGAFGPYDMKVLAEFQLWGIPTLSIGPPQQIASPEQSSTTIEPITGLDSSSIEVTSNFAELTTDRGTIHVDASEPLYQVTHYRPVLPKAIVDLSAAGQDPTGVFITGLEQTTFANHNPVIALPVPTFNQSGSNGEPLVTDDIFPASIVGSFGTFNGRGGVRRQATLMLGQFQTTGIENGETVGVERLFNSVEGVAYFGDPTDTIPPEFHRVEGFIVGNQVSFAVDISDQTPSGPGEVLRVNVCLIDQSGEWRCIDLAQSESNPSRWTGGTSIVGTDVEFFAQGVDGSGVTAASTRKGAMFVAQLPPSAGDVITADVAGNPAPNSPWLLDAIVTLNGPESISVRIDGDDPFDYTGPFAVTGDGVHVVEFSAEGSGGAVLVPIDSSAPTIRILSPTATDYIVGQLVTASFLCLDGGSGLTKCEGSVEDGQQVPGGIGPAVMTVTALDAAGHVSSEVVSFRFVWAFDGFLQPIENLPTLNVAKAGQGIPVRWKLRDATGTIISDVSTFVSASSLPIFCESRSGVDTVEESVPVGYSSVSYEPIHGRFVYNWKTLKEWSSEGNCRRFILRLNDGTAHYADFLFR